MTKGRTALLSLDLANQALGGRSVMDELGEKGTSVSEQFTRRVDERLGTLSRALDSQDKELREERKRVEDRLRALGATQVKDAQLLEQLRTAAQPEMVLQQLAIQDEKLAQVDAGLARVRQALDSGLVQKLEAMGTQVARVAALGSRTDVLERLLKHQEQARAALVERLEEEAKQRARLEHALETQMKQLDALVKQLKALEASKA